MNLKQAALFVGHRFLMTLFLLLVIPTVVFALQEAAPGDPVSAMLGEGASSEQLDAMRDELGLDDPVTTRYFRWLGDALIDRDFGFSLVTRQPAYELVTDRLPSSLDILIPALLLSIGLGVPFGMLAASFPKGIPDAVVRYTNLLMTAPPIFWVALILLLFLGVRWELLPLAGRCPASGDCSLSERVDHLVMPVASLVLFWGGAVAYMTRSFIVDFAAQDAERAKGSSVIMGTVLALPVTFPAVLASMLGSLVLVEAIFSWPGVGRLALDAAFNRDYALMGAVVTTISLVVAGLYFLSMLIYALFSLIFNAKPDGYVVAAQHPLVTVSEQQRAEPADRMPHWEGGAQQVLGAVILGVALLMLMVIVGLAVFSGPINSSILDIDPLKADVVARFAPIGADDHLLGTDSLGRDVLARLLVGERNSLEIAFAAAIISLVIGVGLGLVGGLLDGVPGSFINVPLNWLMLPFSIMPLLMVLLMVMMIDGPSKSALIWGMGLLGWTNVAAITRARVRSIRRGKRYQAHEPAAAADESSSEADEETAPADNVLWHVAISPALMLIYFLAVNTATFLLLEAALGFLGMGLQPPEPSLGAMLADARQYLVQAEHLIYPPGIAIALTVACLTFVAEGIRSTFDFTA